jgi:hypothetical protein
MTTPEQDARTEEELLVDVLLGMRMDRVRDFMRPFGLPTSGTKADLHERVQEAVDERVIPIARLIDYLDLVEPWGRQHVLLLEAGPSLGQGWRRPDGVRRRIAEAEMEPLLDMRRRQRLPTRLALSSIDFDGESLTVTAVERRDYSERAPELDRVEHTADGQLLELKAYRHVVTRGIIALRWNTHSGAAALHISEGFGRYDYADAAGRFGGLIHPFLDYDRFQLKDIRRAIARLHEADRRGLPEARSHRVGYLSRGGRTVEAASSTPSTSVVGEQVVDDALLNVAGAASGRSGNFYWLPRTGPTPADNPITSGRGLHIVLLARDSRVHFMVPSDEAQVTYVLRRIRALS